MDALHPFLLLWQLWLVVGAVGLWRAISWYLAERRLARSGIAAIDRMTGEAFERRLVHLFRSLGWDVHSVGRRGDYGADLVIAKDGTRTVVQAKRWTRNVGVKAVQEANAAPAMYRCTNAMVVTNRYFTAAACKLARANGVELWGRDRLVDALLQTSA